MVAVFYAMVWSLPAGSAIAQGPDPFATPNPKLRTQVKIVVDALTSESFSDNEKAVFDAFFNDYFLLQFAEPRFADPESKISLAELRRGMKGRFFGSGKKGPVYDHLHDLTFAMMKAIIKARFPDDPKYDTVRCNALRYNAMLMIGDLNKEEAPPSGGKPRPSLDALQYMLTVVDVPKAPEYLRVPALLGIERQATCYAEHPLPPDKLQPLVKSMLTLLKQRDPGPNRTAEAQSWLRRMAAQILGLIGSPGVNGGDEVATALASEMRDPKNLISLRCACAAAFSEMKFTGSEKINTADVALDMSLLAYEILKQEEVWAEANDVEPNRRRLKLALGYIADGLVGHGAKHGIYADLSPPASKESLKELVKTVYRASKLADTASLSTKDLAKKREDLEKSLKDPNLPRKVALPKIAPLAAPESEPKSKSRDRNAAGDGPLAADNKSAVNE